MTTATKTKVQVYLPRPHKPYQEMFVDSTYKRIVVRAGRRGGKTVGVAIRNTKRFLQGRRQLYLTPTSEQLGKWWYEVTGALDPLIRLGVFKKNETEHFIEKPGTEQRIKGKTAWNADTARGDYADDLTYDEYQLMNEDAWEIVGQPMLMDHNGDAVFIYTPPSLRSAGVSKAHDPRHAAKMFKHAQEDKIGLWQAIHFTSHDNPHISREALQLVMEGMSKQSYRQEILAEDDEIQLSWLVYRAFNERTNKIDDFEIPKNWLVHTSSDFGPANHACLFVAQDPGTGNFYEFKEYLPESGRSTAQHVEEYKSITAGYNVITRLGGNRDEEDARQGYTSHGWPMSPPRIHKVNAQIDREVGMMELNKIFIFKSLYNRLGEIMNCLWAPDTEGKPTDKIKDEAKYHLSACARYLYCNFTPETVVHIKSRTSHSMSM